MDSVDEGERALRQSNARAAFAHATWRQKHAGTHKHGAAMNIPHRRTPMAAEGLTRVPYWVYSDRRLYEEEQERCSAAKPGPFLCLEAELPAPNTFQVADLGDMPVV